MTVDSARVIAEGVVRRATRFAVYATYDTGTPVDRGVRDALKQAVEAQLEAWEQAGVTNEVVTGGATMEPQVSSTSNQGASVTFDNSAAVGARAHLTGGGLAPAAHAILDAAGLLGGLPGVQR